MRMSMMTLGFLFTFCILPLATADEPSGRDGDAVPRPRLESAKEEDATTVKQELAELKQMIRELSDRIGSLEQTLQSHRLVQMGTPGRLRKAIEHPAQEQPEDAVEPQLITVVYAVHDLGETETVGNLIMKEIVPEYWQNTGRLAYEPKRDILVVQASREVHDEIKQWLQVKRTALESIQDAWKTIGDAKKVLKGLEPEGSETRR